MWDKPSEISNGTYTGNGFGNAYMASSGATATSALSGWIASPGHNAVILEQGIWAGKNWPAMGVGIYQQYAVLWFGDTADAQGGVTTCNSGDTGNGDDGGAGDGDDGTTGGESDTDDGDGGSSSGTQPKLLIGPLHLLLH
jgi:hypothetical protein